MDFTYHFWNCNTDDEKEEKGGKGDKKDKKGKGDKKEKKGKGDKKDKKGNKRQRTEWMITLPLTYLVVCN